MKPNRNNKIKAFWWRGSDLRWKEVFGYSAEEAAKAISTELLEELNYWVDYEIEEVFGGWEMKTHWTNMGGETHPGDTFFIIEDELYQSLRGY